MGFRRVTDGCVLLLVINAMTSNSIKVEAVSPLIFVVVVMEEGVMTKGGIFLFNLF